MPLAVSWLIVVAVVVVAALGVHLAEQARAKRVIAARRAERAATLQTLHQFAWVRQVEETWSADLELLTLTATRSELGSSSERSFDYVLERSEGGVWSMKGADEAWLPVPAELGPRLETQYQRYLKHAAR